MSPFFFFLEILESFQEFQFYVDGITRLARVAPRSEKKKPMDLRNPSNQSA